VASSGRPWVVPTASLLSAASLALALLAVDQLAQYLPGNWDAWLGIAVLSLSLLALMATIPHGWRRRREGLVQRAALWWAAALAAGLLGIVSVVGLVETVKIASVISGADVHLTRPVIESVPRPPGTRLLDQRPGLADTETISEDLKADDLSTIVPFYERELLKRGWVEDKTSATTSIVRFTKGEYVLSVAVDPPSSGYTLIVDRLTASPTPPADASSPAG